MNIMNQPNLQLIQVKWKTGLELDECRRMYEAHIMSGVQVGYTINSGVTILGTFESSRVDSMRLSNGAIIKWYKKEEEYCYKPSWGSGRYGFSIVINAVENVNLSM